MKDTEWSESQHWYIISLLYEEPSSLITGSGLGADPFILFGVQWSTTTSTSPGVTAATAGPVAALNTNGKPLATEQLTLKVPLPLALLPLPLTALPLPLTVIQLPILARWLLLNPVCFSGWVGEDGVVVG